MKTQKIKTNMTKMLVMQVTLLLLFTKLSYSQGIDCTNIQEWDAETVYAIKGTLVKYNQKVYKNEWYTQGDVPDAPDEWYVWRYVDDCGAVLVPPTVSITSPTAGSTFTQGDAISITATASDADGTITQVEFFVGSTSVGVDNTSPYSANWTANFSGSFNITAVATDNDNKTTTSEAVALTINPTGNNIAPTVELTAPADGGTFTEGESIVISANAEDTDGTITSVEFLAGSTSLGVDNTNPYSITWSNAAVGEYAISAIATDNQNALATSPSRTIKVESQTNQLFFSSLPYQIILNQGVSRVYTFDAALVSVLTRNKGIVDVQVNGDQMTITGVKAGRTGLRINTDSESYFMGVRVNHPDGTMPYLPKYLSIGSVSEDNTGDLAFWKDVDIDLTNKEMDIRYIYINGGPINGWRSWNPQRVTNFARESMRFGLIPFFVYYNIPDGGESFDTDKEHMQDPAYMTAYFEDLNIFLDQAQEILQGDLYGIVLEPDFLGYFQQLGELRLGTNRPDEIPTAVSATSIATNAGTITTLVERINATINAKRSEGHSIFFGWQLNLWSYAPTSGGKGVLRRTDDNDLGFTAGRAAIKEAGEKTTQYGIDAGILSNGANFISIDKYGLDAGISNPQDPFNSTWFFNNDHWNNYLYYVENMHLTSGMPIVLWQLPVGHINGSTMVSAYTGTTFPEQPNTATKYEDSTTDFFFGDTFNPGANRVTYFSENKYNDPELQVSGNQITWGDHFQEAKDAGIIVALFGAGVGASTDGIGDPPTDDYFWVQKVQKYYQAGPVVLPKEYGPDDVWDGTVPNKAPSVTITSPAANTIFAANTNITVEASANDTDGTVTKVEFFANGTSIGVNNDSPFSITWQNVSVGNYSLTAVATDDDLATGTSPAVDIVVDDNPPVLTSITITPSTTSIAVNQTQQFSAQGYDQDGNTITVQIDWSANGGSINSSGLYTATTEGTFTVTATSGSVSTDASITVSPASQCNSPQYIENGGYTAGSVVKNNGVEYECKPHPYSGWCNGAAWAYEPGEGTYWADAWIEIGPCTTLKSSQQVQSPTFSVIEGDASIYPNPFNDIINIKFKLLEDTHVEIKLYNNAGIEIYTLLSTKLCSGYHKTKFDGSNLPAGHYIYTIKHANEIVSGNLVKE